MKNMMSQVRNWSKLSIINYQLSILLAVLLLTAGCEKPDPFTTQGNVENPNWVVTVENDMTASMTAIVKVSFSENEGVLAAFMGNECCGIAEYIDGLYWLYISPTANSQVRPVIANVQLKFYSPELKRIFEAKQTFPFQNDTQLGTVSEPYTPEWVVK